MRWWYLNPRPSGAGDSHWLSLTLFLSLPLTVSLSGSLWLSCSGSLCGSPCFSLTLSGTPGARSGSPMALLLIMIMLSWSWYDDHDTHPHDDQDDEDIMMTCCWYDDEMMLWWWYDDMTMKWWWYDAMMMICWWRVVDIRTRMHGPKSGRDLNCAFFNYALKKETTRFGPWASGAIWAESLGGLESYNFLLSA